jgi:energy-converting hydrogenase Eha subunit A
MDEATRIFLIVLGNLVVFALLGAFFGAYSASNYVNEGPRRSGTIVGFWVARQFNQIREEPLSLKREVLLIGGADGLVFGSVVGLIIGWMASSSDDWLKFSWIVAGLVGAALLMGLFATLLQRLGVRAIPAMFTGGMVGALGGFALAGRHGLFVGTLAGSGLGVLLYWLVTRR